MENSNASASFKSAELSLAIQKKIFNRMANKNVMKHFIDETSNHLLDNLHRLIQCYLSESKINKKMTIPKNSEKVVKNVLKIIIKIAILTFNEQFSADEKVNANRLQMKIRSTFMSIISFHEVDYSYDQCYLISSLDWIRYKLKQLVEPHLSNKSSNRIDTVFNFFTDCNFLDRFYQSQRSSADSQNDPIYKIRCELMSDINIMLESGRF